MKTIGTNQPLWQKEEAHKPLSAWLAGRDACEVFNGVAWGVVA